MAAPLHNEGLGNKEDRVATADAEPHIVVFADRQRFVEQADFREYLLPYDGRRGTYDAQGEAVLVDMTGVFLMPFSAG